MDSELTFISSLLTASKAEQAKYATSPVSFDFFVKRKNEITWVYDIYNKTGQFPQLNTFSQKFTVKVFPIVELPEIAIEPVIEHAMYSQMQMITDKSSQLLNQGDPAIEVAKFFKEQADNMNTLSPVFDEVNWGADNHVLGRYSVRKQLMKSNGAYFLTTPWPTVNKAIGFMRPGEVCQIVARLGMGKSYLALWWALFAALKGIKVLFITKEMPKDQVEERLEVMQFRLHPTRFKHCNLTPKEIIQWKAKRKKFSNPNLIINGSETIQGTGLDDVHSAIERLKPQAVFVDGLYLMYDRSIKDRTQRLEAISQKFKRVMKVTNTIGVGVIQFNRGAEANSKERQKREIMRGNVGDIFGSDSFGQDSDIIFGVGGSRELDYFRELDLLKAREAKSGMKVPVKFKFDPHIDFSEASAQYIETEERKVSSVVNINLDFLVKNLNKK